MRRSLELELMDLPNLPGPLLEKFHHDLDRVHGFLGTFPTIERFIRKDLNQEAAKPIRRILDVGCGGGALLRYLRDRLNVEVIGVDLKPIPTPGLNIIAANAVTEPLPEADIAVSSLFSHHLTPDENISLIRNVSRSCRRFVIHDLIRHPLPLVLFTIFLCPLIGREAAVDGRQSIRRAFTPEEFADLVRTADPSARFAIDVSPIRSRQIVDITFVNR